LLFFAFLREVVWKDSSLPKSGKDVNYTEPELPEAFHEQKKFVSFSLLLLFVVFFSLDVVVVVVVVRPLSFFLSFVCSLTTDASKSSTLTPEILQENTARSAPSLRFSTQRFASILSFLLLFSPPFLSCSTFYCSLFWPCTQMWMWPSVSFKERETL
jgi:hypothetical protein